MINSKETNKEGNQPRNCSYRKDCNFGSNGQKSLGYNRFGECVILEPQSLTYQVGDAY